jgi:molybdate transport system substrate-binding protein
MQLWRIRVLCAFFLSMILPSLCLAEPLKIAVASNFAGTLEELVETYQAERDDILMISGGTGKLASQIVEGAPFDVFLSGDDKTLRLLVREGKALGDTEFTYAIGKLALWSANRSLIAADGEAVLKSGAFWKLACANPEIAPYGAAAVAALQALGLYDEVKDKIVWGENVGQAFAMAATGGADLGFVALSQVLGSEQGREGSTWEVPIDLYPAVRQNAILLTRAKDNPAAAAFLAFLKSAAALEIIRKAGYETASD